MNSGKKNSPPSDEQDNAKIQRKFDLVFNENEDLCAESGKEFVMERNGKKSGDSSETKAAATEINIDFSLDENSLELPEYEAATEVLVDAVEVASAKQNNLAGLELIDDGLDFSLDFGSNDTEIKNEGIKETIDISNNSVGFTLDDVDITPVDFVESTKKTVMINVINLAESNLKELDLDKSIQHDFSADLMSTEEAKANIESTIKDIVRPKIDDTKEMDSAEMTSNGLDNIEDSILSFRENTPSRGFNLNDIMGEDAFLQDPSTITNPISQEVSNYDSTGEFDISDLGPSPLSNGEKVKEFNVEVSKLTSTIVPETKPVHVEYVSEARLSMGLGGSNITTEDGMRFHATIRALREEREDMLAQIKHMKNDAKELLQDNLTLKANLDEAKIEITILRKRQMIELEDIKYRLGLSDEKKAMADEKARQADMKREKLEQKVRIDFNQIKQREKELESKLELLSMDVDSQVQSRDQKILELRRKIDALEFNMENASIKEQKSLDDKRRLEDRLNKIMKTLRHSIKNLEDDIDHTGENDDHQKEKN